MNTSENKNLVLAMVLMLAVWLGFSFFFPPTPKEQTQPVVNLKEQSVVTTETQEQPVVNGVVEDKEAVIVNPVTALAVETSAPARDIVVETDKYQAIFTTQGARLVSFKLKEYHTTADKASPPVQMFEEGPQRYSTLRSTGSEGFLLSEDARFETTALDLVEVAGSEQVTLSFQHVTANGLRYVKTFVVRGDEYLIDTSLELNNTSPTPLRGTVDFALVQRWDESLKADSYSFSGPATLVEDKIEEEDVDDLKEGSVAYSKGLVWTYFP